MGNEKTRPIKPLQKFDIEVSCDQIYHHLMLHRDRKINELAAKERDLRDKMRSKKKSYEDVAIEIVSIINIFKYIKATKIVIRYAQILKEHSMRIVEACNTKNFKGIRELVPYFEGLVWSSDKLNLSYIKEFNNLIYVYFGTEIFKQIRDFQFVDKELADCFGSIEPSPYEVNDYLRKFLQRYDITNFEWPNGQQPGVSPFGGARPSGPDQALQPARDDGQTYIPPPNPGNFGIPPPNPGSFGIPPPNPGNFGAPPSNGGNLGSLGNLGNLGGLMSSEDFGAPQGNTGNLHGQTKDLKPPSDETLDDIIKSLKHDLDIRPNQMGDMTTQGEISAPGENFAQAAPVKVTNHDELRKQRGPRPMRRYAEGPEAYTDEKDDNADYPYYEDLPFVTRIQEMRNTRV